MLPRFAQCHPRTGHEVLALATLPLKGNPAPIVQEAKGASGPVWTGAQNPFPTPVLNPQTVHPAVRCYTHIMKAYKRTQH